MQEQFSIFIPFLMFSSSSCFEPVSPYGGSYIVSNNDLIFRIVSHSNFNRKTKYGNKKIIRSKCVKTVVKYISIVSSQEQMKTPDVQKEMLFFIK